ncbi:hypothetical protein CR513_41012, partial [Mucuna pruriens]
MDLLGLHGLVEFKTSDPPQFTRGVDPHIVDRYLNEIKKIFKTMGGQQTSKQLRCYKYSGSNYTAQCSPPNIICIKCHKQGYMSRDYRVLVDSRPMTSAARPAKLIAIGHVFPYFEDSAFIITN